MKIIAFSKAAMLLVLGTYASTGLAFLEFRGSVGYSYLNNEVTLTADEIRNTSSNTISGTVHLQLIATVQSSPFGTFFRLADFNLSQLPNQFPEGSGRIPPGGAFTDITAETTFTPPPDGTYFMHMVVTQFDPDEPNDGLNTFLDTATFNGQETFGNPAADDHGNSTASATLINPNSSTAGAIDSSGDVDVFRIDLNSSGILTVGTSGNTDTVGELLGASGTVIAENDDGPNGLNFALSEALSSGTYYVRVSHFSTGTGAYTLESSFAPDASQPLVNDAGISGIFFDPATSGQGFNVTYGTPGLTIFFYGHTSDGQRLWLASETLAVDLRYNEAVTLDMFEVPQGAFGNPDAGSLAVWGTLTITISDCDTVSAVLEGADGTQTMSLTRLSDVAGVGC